MLMLSVNDDGTCTCVCPARDSSFALRLPVTTVGWLLPAALPPDEDEVTALIFARQGLLYSGHISGMVRKWELPTAGSSEDEEEEEEEEEEEAPQAVDLQQQRQQQRQQGQQQAAHAGAAGQS